MLLLVACQQQGQLSQFEGDWKVLSNHHNAKYRVESDGKALNAFVLKYNDGTTRYTFDTKDTHFVFKRISTIDATTGATVTGDGNSTSLQSPDMDTLILQTTSNNTTTTEILYRL